MTTGMTIKKFAMSYRSWILIIAQTSKSHLYTIYHYLLEKGDNLRPKNPVPMLQNQTTISAASWKKPKCN